MENEIYKPKDHPGRIGLKPVEIPERIHDAIKVCVNGGRSSVHCFHLPDFLIVCHILDNQIPQLLEDGAKLDRYLFARHIPLEQKDVYVAKKEIEKDILNKTGVNRASELGLTIRSQAYTDIFLNSDIKVMRMNYISRNG